MKIKINEKQYLRILKEMRFDNKNTGLFKDEEPQEMNEFFGNIKEKWGNFLVAAKNESKETGVAAQILKKYILNKENVSDEELSFLKNQSIDLLKIVGLIGLGSISSIIPITLEKLLNKKGKSILPNSHLNKKEIDSEKTIVENRPKSEKSESGRKIPGKYLTKNKSAMKKEIDKYAGKDTYKTKWDADYKSGKGGEGKRYETKKSDATKAYERMYGNKNESFRIDENESSTDETLTKKSKASGIPKSILKQVHSRGMDAWNSGHIPGTPQNAWAMGRVNSFITGEGGARKADKDLWEKAKKSKDKKKKNESINYDRMFLTESNQNISEGLKYHLETQTPLTENIYRYGSDNFFKLINEVRDLYSKGKIDLSFSDEELINSNIGEKGFYGGKDVWIDLPMEEVTLYEAKYNGREVDINSPKKSGSLNYVYVKGCLKDKNKVKKITYGSSMPDKLKDPKRRKAFSARHGCKGLSLKDKCTKKYWSCRKPSDFASINAWW